MGLIAARLETKRHLVRQEIVFTELGTGIATHKGFARPEVAKADHV